MTVLQVIGKTILQKRRSIEFKHVDKKVVIRIEGKIGDKRIINEQHLPADDHYTEDTVTRCIEFMNNKLDQHENEHINRKVETR